jgi:coenzyme F420-0:L-glutamate ligase/coenzyme F420-1:gamma-L-glutamate ligase
VTHSDPRAEPPGLVLRPVRGLGEVSEGTDLAALLDGVELHDGDVVVVTSKVVSKAEGRVTAVTKEEAVASETEHVVARRGPTTIARTRHGLVLAAAGVDASNVTPGLLVLLPRDPDASARRLRAGLAGRRGVNLAVVVSDTAGRAWRTGQTDIAIGAAGLCVADDHAGRVDPYGNALAVTLPAVADEVAGAAELATGKLSQAPVTVVRGLAHLVLPAGQDGPGAAALVRPAHEDMFGLGAREAVTEAVRGGPGTAFGAPAPRSEVLRAVREALGDAVREARAGRAGRAGPRLVLTLEADDDRGLGRVEAGLSAVAVAHGWRLTTLQGRRAVLEADAP